MSYYPVGVLLVLSHLCGVEGHSGTGCKGQSITTEPVSLMLLRLTVPVRVVCSLIVVGTGKLLCCQTH